MSRLRRAEEGATMVEYALMVSLVAAISVAAVVVLGTTVQNAFSNPAL
jgi:Flp pilus assembly pilin Flp